MRVIRKKTYEEASMACAELIASQIRLKPDCKIGLATGSTPIGTYKDLVDMYKAGSLDFSKVTSANLDEYRGLGGDHDQSYRYFMNTNLFDHVNIDKNKTYVPNGLEADAEKACKEYDAILESLGDISTSDAVSDADIAGLEKINLQNLLIFTPPLYFYKFFQSSSPST